MAQLTKITMTVSGENQADLLSAFLCTRVAHGWEETSFPNDVMQATAYFAVAEAADEITAAFASIFPEGRIDRDIIEEENWAEAWKEYFTPVEGGDHFYVLAPWMEKERQSTKRIPIIIEPKTAFGTGHHGTTSLCLDVISRLAGEQRLGEGKTFLDLGTGSGILGIACAKLGMTGLGLDIDIIAVDNALENRELNNVAAAAFEVAKGGTEGAKGPYDLVLANILAEPLKDMAKDIVATVKKDGTATNGLAGVLVLSGMLDHQTDSVEQVYRGLGLGKAEKLVKGEWAALIFG